MDSNRFGGLILDDKICLWSDDLCQKLAHDYPVDREIRDQVFQNCSNEVFLEKSISLTTLNMIQSDRISKDEDQINRIVKPILYELLRDGSIDMTPKNDTKKSFFDVSGGAGGEGSQPQIHSQYQTK